MRRFCIIPLMLFTLLIYANQAYARTLIRDEEIETVLREIAMPLFAETDLVAENVHIYIVNDPSINAYVTGGMNIFIHTGLLSFSSDYRIIAGVLAHEIGHIEGGHLVKNLEAYRLAALSNSFTSLLGVAAIAAGAPQVGQAILLGGTHATTRNVLKHSRTHEEAADQAAIRLLKANNISVSGLVELLEHLNVQEYATVGERDPYGQTHPLSHDRIAYLRNHIATEKQSTSRLQQYFERIHAKLQGFLEDSEKTLLAYPEEDQTVNARYGRAIAYYKIPNIERSLYEVNGLIAEYPEDPYFHELKAQILYENGYAERAVLSYRDALERLPHSDLFKVQLATAQLATEDTARIPEAIEHLQEALHGDEEHNIFAWQQLAIAHGRAGNLGLSYLALVEKSLRLGNKEDVEKYAALVKKYIKEGTPAALRLQDIMQQYQNDK